MAKFVPDVTVTLRMHPDKGTETLVAIADMTSPEYDFSHPNPSVMADVYRKRLTKVHRLASDALEVVRQPESNLSGKLQDEFRKVGEAFRALGKAVGVASPSKVSGEEILRVVEEMRPGRIVTLPAGATVSPVTGRLADVSVDRLKIKIGTLEIESGPTVFSADCKILFDGKPAPPLRGLTLSFVCRGPQAGFWQVVADMAVVPGVQPDQLPDVQPDKIL
jgi:hypothetical protein